MLLILARLLPLLPLLSTQAPAPAPPTRIVNALTGASVPYSSLGIRNKPIGTVADSMGGFDSAALHGATPTGWWCRAWGISLTEL